ncbi:uncharacterized protein [Miscanthus floridulus]|uniref:uncharacterized protein n=1 Tax=Miscanthus floridulus TaxID=154761 RepID=UPI00345A6074
MASVTKTACLLVLALFVISAVILPTSVCHGARGVGIGGGALNPNHPACIGACPAHGRPYRPLPRHGDGPGASDPTTPLPPSNGDSPRR